MGINEKLHKAICDKGRKIWRECYSKPRNSDEVGMLVNDKIAFDGKEYDLDIDCYWDRSKYFDYHIKGHDIDYNKFVASYMD